MKKYKLLDIIIVIIFLIFVCSYYISNSGYYEYELNKKTVLTNEKIKEFEEDVKNNMDVDIKEYLLDEEVSYANKITNAIYELSDSGNKLVKKGLKSIFKKLSNFIEEDD